MTSFLSQPTLEAAVKVLASATNSAFALKGRSQWNKIDNYFHPTLLPFHKALSKPFSSYNGGSLQGFRHGL